jgi:hypothetical protein
VPKQLAAKTIINNAPIVFRIPFSSDQAYHLFMDKRISTSFFAIVRHIMFI